MPPLDFEAYVREQFTDIRSQLNRIETRLDAYQEQVARDTLDRSLDIERRLTALEGNVQARSVLGALAIVISTILSTLFPTPGSR